MKIKNLLVVLALSLPLSVSAEPTQIEVFVEQPLSTPVIPNTKISIFDLSQVEAVRATSPKFPADPLIAKGMAEKWLTSSEGKQYISTLKLAYAGRIKMVTYGVLKLPAIVFDNGKYVIYGTTDLLQAVQDYDEFRRKNPTKTLHHGG